MPGAVESDRDVTCSGTFWGNGKNCLREYFFVTTKFSFCKHARDVSRENIENDDICLLRLFSHTRKFAGVTRAVSNKAINYLWNFVTRVV